MELIVYAICMLNLWWLSWCGGIPCGVCLWGSVEFRVGSLACLAEFVNVDVMIYAFCSCVSFKFV